MRQDSFDNSCIVTKTRTELGYPLLLVLALTRPFPLEYWGAISVRIIDVIVSLLVVFYLQFNKKIFLNRANTLLLKGIIAFTACYLLSTLTHLQENTFASIPELFRFFLVFPFALLGAAWAREGHFEKTFIKALSIIVVLTVIVAIMQYVFHGTPIDSLYATKARLVEFAYNNRSIGLYWNPNLFSFVLLALFSILIYFDIKKILIFFVIVGIILSGSRTGLGVLVILSCFVLFRQPKQAYKLLLLIGLVILLLMICFAPYLPGEPGTPWFRIRDGLKTISHITENTSMMGKIYCWKSMAKFIQESPWIGMGPMRGVISSTADNYYIYLMVRSGLLGLAFYILFLWGLMTLSVKADRTSFMKRYVNITLLLVIFVAVSNIVAEAFIVTPILTIFFIWFGVLSEKGAGIGLNET